MDKMQSRLESSLSHSVTLQDRVSSTGLLSRTFTLSTHSDLVTPSSVILLSAAVCYIKAVNLLLHADYMTILYTNTVKH